MSDYSYIAVPVGKNVQGMDISPKFGAYTGVEIVKSEDSGTETVIRSDTFSPESGRIFRISNPWGTKEQANNILARLQGGFQYQPYSAIGAEVNPAAEIGDGITANNVYSGIYKMSKNFTSLMASDVSAPQDEEVNHEYPYEPKQERVYKREIYAMQSSIRQTAEQIRADVVKKVDGSGNGDEHFGWVLNSTSWSLVSGSATVFRADKSGVTINGIINAKSGGTIGGFNIGVSSIYKTKQSFGDGNSGVYIGTDGIALGADKFSVSSSGALTAKSGTIGGFSIGSSSIYKTKTAYNDNNEGVYIGTNGIGLGKKKFYVTSAGSLYAENANLEGTLTVGGAQITASALRTGATAGTGAQGIINQNKSKWDKAATDASSALTKAGKAQEKAEDAMGAANSATTSVSNLVSGSATFSKLKLGQIRLGGNWRTLGTVTININGTNYNLVSYS